MGRELVEADDGLVGLAMGQGSGAEDERAVADGFGESRGLICALEQFCGSHCGFCFAPVRFIRGDNGEVREAEVGHGTSHCADVERVARRDEDDSDAIALLRCKQGMIVEPEELMTGCLTDRER